MSRPWLAASLGLILVTAGEASAQSVCSWSTVDDFVPSAALGGGAAAALVAVGGTYVIGSAYDSPTGYRWLVRKSSNGRTWSTVDDWVHTPGVRNSPRGLARDIQGNLFVVGGANNASEGGAWLVRRSSDDGQSWALVDEFTHSPLSSSVAMGVAVDLRGTLTVVGSSYDGGAYHWMARRSGDAGATWTMSDDHLPIYAAAQASGGVTVDPRGDWYAAGLNWNGYQYQWQVRRLLAGQATWSTVDDVMINPNSSGQTIGAQPAEVVAAGPGEVFVAGVRVNATGSAAYWLVRRTLDGGGTWTTVDDLSGSPSCLARGIAFDVANRALYVVGRCAEGGVYRWVVRRSNNKGASWQTVDSFSLSGAAHSYPSGVSVSGSGEVTVVGQGSDGTRSHWLVRKGNCQGPHTESTTTVTFTRAQRRTLGLFEVKILVRGRR